MKLSKHVYRIIIKISMHTMRFETIYILIPVRFHMHNPCFPMLMVYSGLVQRLHQRNGQRTNEILKFEEMQRRIAKSTLVEPSSKSGRSS